MRRMKMWETYSVYSVKSELGEQKSNTGNSQKQENHQVGNKEIRQGIYLKNTMDKGENGENEEEIW